MTPIAVDVRVIQRDADAGEGIPSALASAFGNERKYFGVLYNNDEPGYRRSGGRGVSESERSRRPGEPVATSDPIELAAEILTAFVANNSVPRAALAALFEGLHSALKKLVDGGEVVLVDIVKPEPAVPIRKSVTPDYLICLDDGRKFRTLRRHLAGLGMTPEQYRQKWSLSADYPMVAPNYTAQRSAFAKNIGFGLREKPIAAPPASGGESETVAGTIEAIAAEPASVAKPKSKRKAVAAPRAAPAKRKPGRPRKTTA